MQLGIQQEDTSMGLNELSSLCVVFNFLVELVRKVLKSVITTSDNTEGHRLGIRQGLPLQSVGPTEIFRGGARKAG